MNSNSDIVIIGYNEIPFTNYLTSVLVHGEKSGAYKDLRPNYFLIENKPNTYIDLLNTVSGQNLLSCDIPNLAAVYLSNFLLKRGINAVYINLFQQEKEKLRLELDKKPLCVAITTTFYVSTIPVIEMVRFIRSCNPEIPIVVGGVLVSNLFNTYQEEVDFFFSLEDMGADMYILESQGELTLYNLVMTLKEKKQLSGVCNLIYSDSNGDWKMNSRMQENNSLDEENINWNNFKDYELGVTLQTRTARSCAFACAFCGYPERGGPLVSAKIETVQRELETMRSLGIKNLVFIDDTFNVPKGRFKELCNMLIDQKFNFNWFSYYRCDHGDEETIELMRKSGCKGVFLGIESGSQAILEKMNKRAKIINYQKGIKHLKENGILTFASFITGYPGETRDTISETINFIKENKPDYWRSMLWYCDPLTPVYKKRKDEFGLEGEGFNWSHYTMNSQEAADHLHEIFLHIDPTESIWMPQYSFDFWIIPYLLGKGISLSRFKEFMALANKAMRWEINGSEGQMKSIYQMEIFNEMRNLFTTSIQHLA